MSESRGLGGRLVGLVAGRDGPRPGTSKRFGWGLADQALSSLTNFALTFFVARSVNATAFGDFGIAFTVYLTALGTTRAAIVSPLGIRYSTSSEEAWSNATRSATGAAFVVGAAIGTVCIVIGLLLEGVLSQTLLVLGFALPALMLQDAWRFAFFARGRGFHAFVNDLVWAASLLAALVGISGAAHGDVGWYIAAWGGASAIAGVFGIYQAKLVPAPQATLGWWLLHRRLTNWYVAEFMSTRGSIQLLTFVIAAYLGVEAIGALRGAAVLLGPVTMIMMGLSLVAVPEGARLLAIAPKHLRRLTSGLSAAVAALALGWGALLLLIPDALGASLLGKTWPAARDLILPVTLGVALGGAAAGFSTGLRSLGASKATFRARVLVTILGLAGTLGGAIIGGSAKGVAWGDDIANALAFFVWWRFFHASLRDAEMGDGRRASRATPEGNDPGL